MASSVAKEAGDASTADDNRACSDGGSRENKYGNGILTTEGRVCTMKPIYHGGG